MKKALSTTLAVLFLLLSFNAYACVLLTPDDLATQGQCPSAEQPVTQCCDVFKTSAVQSFADGATHSPVLISWAAADETAHAPLLRTSLHRITSPQHLSIVTSTVLRI